MEVEEETEEEVGTEEEEETEEMEETEYKRVMAMRGEFTGGGQDREHRAFFASGKYTGDNMSG